jgi:ubiquinone/menaquinone biosynthesis C-methylase UbiE
VAEGQTVVDYGCGPGYFTLAAAELVGPAGKVYAIDVEPSMVALVTKRATDARFSNVEAGLSDGTNAPVPAAVADFVVCVLIMHYQETHDDRVAVARDIARVLKPGGQVMLVQWKSEHGGTAGISHDSLAEVMAEAGLATEGPYHASDRQYRAVARKP